MKEFKTFTEFRFNMDLVPVAVAFDVVVRVNDWLLSGGNIEDEYIKRQLQYVSQFIEVKEG